MGVKTKEENGNGGLHNALSTGTSVIGNITTGTDFRIDGHIKGDVCSAGKIVIGSQGSILGNIQAENAEILGSAEGNIQIKEKLTLKASAVIKGELSTGIIEIEPGARFNGTCKMTEKKVEKQ
ncbi:polymer-forming cytoskeletal protein [Parabacteroides sp. Marseille-P3160]|uniref:bactofilin family protein n=1 Tax=Parabacteroides sp. Marseille-P3160 TaxID=1917887 RepID=UPI0009BAA975|nr:polymer-forming cytoskeletal protein [Parabacteroides sp. Marseille-P3160]